MTTIVLIDAPRKWVKLADTLFCHSNHSIYSVVDEVIGMCRTGSNLHTATTYVSIKCDSRGLVVKCKGVTVQSSQIASAAMRKYVLCCYSNRMYIASEHTGYG